MAKKRKDLWKPSRSALENARSVLPGLTADYLKASRKLTADDASPKALHKFRIKTKRFRYILELFRSCCGPGLGSRLEALKRLQQDLGDINDYAMARRVLSGKHASRSGRFAPLLRSLDARTKEKTATLLRQVQRSLHARGQRRWWTAYLAGASGRTGGRSGRASNS